MALMLQKRVRNAYNKAWHGQLDQYVVFGTKSDTVQDSQRGKRKADSNLPPSPPSVGLIKEVSEFPRRKL